MLLLLNAGSKILTEKVVEDCDYLEERDDASENPVSILYFADMSSVTLSCQHHTWPSTSLCSMC